MLIVSELMLRFQAERTHDRDLQGDRTDRAHKELMATTNCDGMVVNGVDSSAVTFKRFPVFYVRRRAPPGTSGSRCPSRSTITMTIGGPRNRRPEIDGNLSAPAGSVPTTSGNRRNFHPAGQVSFLPFLSFLFGTGIRRREL